MQPDLVGAAGLQLPRCVRCTAVPEGFQNPVVTYCMTPPAFALQIVSSPLEQHLFNWPSFAEHPLPNESSPCMLCLIAGYLIVKVKELAEKLNQQRKAGKSTC